MLISVKVRVKSGRQEVIEIVKDKEYEVYVKSEAEQNKANLEVIRLVAKYFNIQDSKVRLRRGLTSRKKIVEVII